MAPADGGDEAVVEEEVLGGGRFLSLSGTMTLK